MNELRDLLERGAGQFEAPPGGWDRLLRRAGRRRAVRRVTAGVVALAVAGGGIGVVMAAFRGTEHRQPAAAVENGPIAYVLAGSSDWDIYTVMPDGTGRTRLTDERGWDQESTWSPDGTRIAFTTFRPNVEGNPPAIWVMNADGSDQHLLVENAFGPSWSPDGRRIAFSGGVGGNVDVYATNTDGTGLVRLTDDPARDVSPTWSPDSTRIAFVRANGSGFGPLFLMNADGSNASEMLSDPVVGDPRWSPVGDTIVFDTPRGGNTDGPTDIFLVNADGTALTRLTDNEARELSPGWAPDGSKIVFCSDRFGVRQIYVMNPDGSALTQVTNGAEPAAFPAWGPMPGPPIGPSPPEEVSPSPPTGESAIAARTPVPGAVDLALGFGSVWVSGFGKLTRVDPVTDRIQATISVHGIEDFSDVAVGDGSVWVSADGGLVYRVDPGTNEVIDTIRTGLVDMSLALADGYLWVASPGTGPTEPGTLIRMDPQTGLEVGTPISVGTDPHVVVFDEGSLWVSGGAGIERVDPATGAVTKVPGALRTYSLALGAGSIWSTTFVSSTDELTTDRVLRIDTTTMRVVDEIPIPRASAVAFADGVVWVMTSPTHKHPETTVLRIDPTTDHVVGNALRLPGSQPIAMVAQGTSAWIADYTDQTLTRVEAVSAGPSA